MRAGENALGVHLYMQPRYTQNTTEIQPKYNRDTPKIQPKYNGSAFVYATEIQLKGICICNEFDTRTPRYDYMGFGEQWNQKPT